MHKLFFVFSIGLAIHAQTIHVNPYGPANGDGSSGAPFNNIAAAVARANTIGGIPTILIDPGYYPISDTIKVEAPMTLQGSEVLQVDPQGWPTGVVLSGERRLVGTSDVANKTMISVAKSGSVLYNVAIGGISFEGVAGTGSILDMAWCRTPPSAATFLRERCRTRASTSWRPREKFATTICSSYSPARS